MTDLSDPENTVTVHIAPAAITDEEGTPLIYPMWLDENGKVLWLCAGNLPETTNDPVRLRKFLAWAEPLRDTYADMDTHIDEAKDKLRFHDEAEARGLREPGWPSTPETWESYARSLKPLLEISTQTRYEIYTAMRTAELLRTGELSDFIGVELYISRL